MIKVTSEYKKLKKVLLHRPYRETENMTPSTYEELLFDDFYWLERAQQEHDQFAEAMRKEGVEVVYLEDLVAETYDQVDEATKKEFLSQFIKEAGIPEISSLYGRLMEYLTSISDTKEMIIKMMEGIMFKDIENIKSSHESLAEMVFDDYFLTQPMPNLIFTRDPFASIGLGISLHSMKRETRKRETLFSSFIFSNHPEYKDTPRYYERHLPNSIEGGDVTIFSETEIAVGISVRTDADAIEMLAKNVFSDPTSKITKIYGINIPKGRAWMHLDTVFTQIDIDKFAIFTNYEFDIFVIEKTGDDGSFKIEKIHEPMDKFLAKVFDVPSVNMIQCGNGDPFIAEREQWNDGSNLLAIAPNTVVAYNRNYVTNKALKDAGVNVIEIESSELSRGRGGPRCMSMPLIRED